MKKSNPLYCIDIYPQGIVFGKFRCSGLLDAARALNLRVKEGDFAMVRAKLDSNSVADPLQGLENKLLRLQQQGQLSQSRLVLGVDSDPFVPFQGKFDNTMKIFKLFERFKPGHLCVQTRSPLIVLAMPVLRAFGKQISVSIPLESNIQSVLERYTPGLPRIEERLKAMATLRNFSVEVQAQVSPLLPYGDWNEGAKKFAELLDAHADYIKVSPLNHPDEKNLRTNTMAKYLAEVRQFHYLRPDACQPLLENLQALCPEKLTQPERDLCKERQLSIFAA